ncbi:hypothetical protein [Rhizobium terrae]|uniref:hypothetical protein n=1 Tax=Rhizobium terrae TaxID=2171756 RepID=UPI0013C320EF|nr:hypothetical protein [Rhizobium terrae]
MKHSRERRLEKQRIRSKENRKLRREGRIADLDNIARVALRWMLSRAAGFGDVKRRHRLENVILDALTRLGAKNERSPPLPNRTPFASESFISCRQLRIALDGKLHFSNRN